VYDIHFTTPTKGWACGFGGQSVGSPQIHRTTDGGITWITYTFQRVRFATLYKIFFADSSKGWAIGDSIYHTIDGGMTWQGIGAWTKSGPQAFVMFGPIGYVGTSAHGVYKSTDGGLTWTEQVIPTSPANDVESLSFLTPQLGWAVGWGGVILHTTNGGVTPVQNAEPPDQTPRECILTQNYPNPFNPSTTITFFAPKTGFATIKIFDILGRETETLLDDKVAEGYHSLRWGPTTMSSSVYICRLQFDKIVRSRKLVFLK